MYEASRNQRGSRYAYILCETGYRESSSDMYLSIYWVSNVPLRDSTRPSERRRPKTRTKRKRESRGGGEGRKRRSRLNYGSRLKRRIQIDPIYHITWHLYSPFCGRISPLFPGHPIVLLLSLPLSSFSLSLLFLVLSLFIAHAIRYELYRTAYRIIYVNREWHVLVRIA